LSLYWTKWLCSSQIVIWHNNVYNFCIVFVYFVGLWVKLRFQNGTKYIYIYILLYLIKLIIILKYYVLMFHIDFAIDKKLLVEDDNVLFFKNFS